MFTMKLSVFSSTKVLTGLLGFGLLGQMAVLAADPPPEALPQGQPINRQNLPATRLPAPLRGGFFDEKQRGLVREGMQKYGDDLRKLAEQLREAQREVLLAIMATNSDEKLVREKAEAAAKLQVEETLMRAKVLAPVAPTLTADQRAQLDRVPLPMLMNALGGARSPMERIAVPPGEVPARPAPATPVPAPPR
jgi:Spy/CpxP family protein refolding chaperone